MKRLDLSLTLPRLFALARYFSKEEGTAFLYSGGNLDSAKRSFLFLFPFEKLTLEASPGCWEALKRRLNLESPFSDWVGYIGYEMGAYSDPDKRIQMLPSSLPDSIFYRCACVLTLDHATGKAWAAIHEDKIPPQYANLSWISEVPKYTGFTSGFLKIASRSDTLQTYMEKIEEAKEWIRAGEIYQVNLSQEFVLEGMTTPFLYFERVSQINPASFSAYVQCGSFAIVSSSPERLLLKEGTRLQTRPIKGTAPRGKTFEEDVRQREYLKTCEKEKAELLMITDLMRSDLGKLALPGSVQTQDLWRVEAYTNVFHLLSIIEANISDEKHPIDILRAIFPGGSITGCPKLRAMEAIAALEKRPRGLYTGSIGYFSGNKFDFNIAIRTLVVHSKHIQIQLGGAIVIDSDPKREYEETLHKGDSLFRVLGVQSKD